MQLKALVSTLVFLGSMALTTAQIQAASFTLEDSFSVEITERELKDQPLRVDLFDLSLGTLTKVTVTLNGLLTSDGTVTNNTTQPQTFTISTRAQGYVGKKAGRSPAVLPVDFAFVTPLELIGSQTYPNLASGIPQAFGPFSTQDTGFMFTSTTLADLAQFVGSGTFGYDFNAPISLLILDPPDANLGISNDIITRANANLKVTYEYEGDLTAISEPTTVSLLGLGLLGLAYARRRQSQKA